MGLDTTHDCWHGSYSLFNTWRYELARQIGIDLDEYSGYRGEGGKPIETIEHDLMPLFNHSDCDGELTVDESERIANGLNSILENLKDAPEGFKEDTTQFRDGLLNAISNNEVVEFR